MRQSAWNRTAARLVVAVGLIGAVGCGLAGCGPDMSGGGGGPATALGGDGSDGVHPVVVNFRALAVDEERRREAGEVIDTEEMEEHEVMPGPGPREVPPGTQLAVEPTVTTPPQAPARRSHGTRVPVSAGVEPLAPTLAGNFRGLDDRNAYIPPDTNGAVGPNHVLITVNGNVQIQDRAGAVISKVTLDTFWGSTGATGTFDPRILYDPYSQRWLMAASANAATATSSVLVGASQSSDPTGNWNLYKLDADAADKYWADYPIMGFSKDWVVITINLFANSNNAYLRGDVYTLDKAAMYAGANVPRRVLANTDGALLSPAATYDTNLPYLYLLGSWNPNSGGIGYLRVYKISGSVGAETMTSVGYASTANPWSDGFSDFAPQKGSANKLEVIDDRFATCVYRNGLLWSAHTILLPAANPTRASVQWWSLDPSQSPVPIIQRGLVDDPNTGYFYAFGSLSVNKENDVLVGYSRFSANEYAGSDFSFRCASDPASTLETDTVLKAGEAPYYKTYGGSSNRWGDYSSTVVDPTDDLTLWTTQEYAWTPGGGRDRWSTWWGRVRTPAPILDPIGAKTTYYARNLTFTVTSSDPNNQGLTYSATPLPVGASLDPATGVFSWTPTCSPDQSGSYSIVFTVSNGSCADSETVSITVSVDNCLAQCAARACNDGNACTADSCNSATGCVFANVMDGTGCDDHNVCTQGDSCQAGACTPGAAAPNGNACDDGNLCTQTDTCQMGACTGGNPVVCVALDGCHEPGSCDPSTGACSNPASLDGKACSDGNLCTQTDTCAAGACVGANPVICAALDQCHDIGVCDGATGVCSNPTMVDGSRCTDNDACTQTDSCQAGACVGGNPVVCAAVDSCHDVGACDPMSGQCTSPVLPDGTGCNDNDACTSPDTCTAGVCKGVLTCAVVTTDKATYAAVDNIAVSYSNMPGNAHDWIAIALDGAPPGKYLQFAYTGGAKAGTITFSPLPPGTFRARAFFNDGNVLEGESQAFTVLPSMGQTTIATDANTYDSGQTVTVTYSGMAGYPHDWIGIAPAGSPPSKYIQFAYTGGAHAGVVQIASLPPGTYVARAFFNDAYQVEAESAPFVVNASNLSATISTSSGQYASTDPIAVTYGNMAGYPHDWIGLAPAGSPAHTYVAFAYTGGFASGTMTFAALPPGTWVARAFFNDGYDIQAESAPFVVDAGNGAVTVTTAAQAYEATDPIVVSYSGLAGYAHDWVAIAAAGSPAHSYVQFNYTGGQRASTMTFAPLPPGTWVARIFFNDGYDIQAESTPFTVAVSNSPPTVTTQAQQYTVGDPVVVNYSGMQGYPHDWIGIAAAGSPGNSYVQFNYTGGARSGTMTFTAPSTGTWVARAFFNDGNNIEAESTPFTTAP